MLMRKMERERTHNFGLYDLDNSMKFDSSVNHGGNDAIVIRRDICVYYHVS